MIKIRNWRCVGIHEAYRLVAELDAKRGADLTPDEVALRSRLEDESLRVISRRQ